MSIWTYDNKLQDPYEQEIYKKIFRLTKSKELSLKASKNLGLFNYLKNNNFDSSEKLRNSVFLSPGKKLFSEKDSEKVFEFFNTLPKEQLQKGGAQSSNAYDALVERWLSLMFYLMPGTLQESIKFVEPFMFPLSEKPGAEGIITKIPGIGLGINFALDVVAQNNKLAAKLAQQYTPMIMGLAPIPEASTVGIIIGYMISTMFIFFNMLVFVTRHDFGEAFTQSLALFPFIGLAMQNMAESGEKVVEKFAAKRQKLIDQLKSTGIFSFLGDLIESYTFDPLYEGNPAEDAQKLKDKFQGHLESAQSTFKDLADPLKRQELMEKTQTQFDTAKTLAQQKLEELKSHPQLQTFKNKVSKLTKPNGGKRLSKEKLMKNKKWKTHRKLNK